LVLTDSIKLSWIKSWIALVTCWGPSMFKHYFRTLNHWLLVRNQMNGYSFLWTADIIFGILQLGLKKHRVN